MIIWINGAFGSGKTTTAFELHKRLENSFVYDPENVGYFIRANTPSVFLTGDFQNIELWREMNYKMLKLIRSRYDGIIIVPMTLVNPQYYDEIVTRLMQDGIKVKHYILYAQKETIKKRLRLRISGLFGKETFALKAIDRCIYSFDNNITDEKIITDNMSVDSIVNEIAQKANLELLLDNRSRFKKFVDKYIILLKHIR